jgi:hypothetical protein
MRKSLIMLVLVAILATPALAERVVTYDWAGSADYLGCFNTDMLADVGAGYNRDGSAGNGLCLTKNNFGGGYALGFVATVWNLQEGDQVTVSIWRYDNMSDQPYFALWSHYNDHLEEAVDARGQDMDINDGNCYGDQKLGAQNGWEEYTHTWTIAAGHTGLVIDAQVYGPTNSQLWVDDMTITVPDHANVRTPGAIHLNDDSVTAFEAATWSQVKTLFE